MDPGTPTLAVDHDRASRPGTPKERRPAPWPNAIYPPEPQRSSVKVFRHGGPHEPMPPVFGTAVPPQGLSGRIREAAYRHPDHVMRHWTMLLFADRVDVWERRARAVLPLALPVLALGVAGVAWRVVFRR
jgi:hypothetical protein